MKTPIKSLFNLIENLRAAKKESHAKAIDAASHCEQKHHHDFYCDTEKPFIYQFNNP